MRVGIIADEIFDRAALVTGGFGWLDKELGIPLRDAGNNPVLLAGMSPPSGLGPITTTNYIPLIFASDERSIYVGHVEALQLDLLVSIGYRPNYDFPLSALPEISLLNWVQDPQPPWDMDERRLMLDLRRAASRIS